MSPNRWLKLTIETGPEMVEPITDFLVGIFNAGVETGAKDEPGYGTIQAYLGEANPSEQEIASTVKQVEHQLQHLAELFQNAPAELSWELFVEEDWSRTWKEHFEPFAIVPGLVIAPTWVDYQRTEDEAILVMDPGMAFGTGHHATTRLCLQALQRTLSSTRNVHVLDVGTGTGILAMAALCFGASKATALDNDPEAVRVATENAMVNGVAEKMEVSLAPLADLQGDYDVVVANIVHDVLISMVSDLSRLTRNGGTLILSGLLAGEQSENIKRTYQGHGLSPVQEERIGEWAALSLQKG